MSGRFVALVLIASCGGAARPVVDEVKAPAGPPIAGTEPATLQLERAHGGAVMQLAWSPDGSKLATQTWPPEAVKIWDAQAGTLVREIPVASQDWSRIAWSGDGTQLAIHTTSAARVVDLDRGTEVALALDDAEVPIAGLPGGGWIVEKWGKRALLDGTKRTPLAEQPDVDLDTLAVTPDGGALAALSRDHREVVSWRLTAGTTARSPLPDYAQGALALADGVLGAWSYDHVTLFDDRDRALPAIDLADGPTEVTASPDRAWIAAHTFRGLQLIGADGLTIASISDAEAVGSVVSVSASPDGAHLALGGMTGGLVIVDPRTGAIEHRLGFPIAAPIDVAFLDGDRLLVATARGLVTFDLGTAAVDGDLPLDRIEALASVPGRGFVVTRWGGYADPPCAWVGPDGAGGAYLTHEVVGAAGAVLPVPPDPGRGVTRAIRLRKKAAAAAAVTPAWDPPAWTLCANSTSRLDGAAVPSGRFLTEELRVGDGAVHLGVVGVDDPASVRWLEPALPYWTAPQVSHDGKRAFAIGSDLLAGYSGYGLWDLDTGVLLQQAAPLYGVVVGDLSDDGRWFAIAMGGSFVTLQVDQSVDELKAAAVRDEVAVPAGTILTQVTVADDGTAIAVSTTNQLFVGRAGKLLGQAQLAATPARVVFGGDRIATISDGAVQLWRRDGTRVLDLHLFQDGEWIAVAPDGVYRASFEASRRISWRFDGPLASVDLARYGDRYADRDELVRRLSGEADAPAPRPPRPPELRWRGTPTRDGAKVHVALDVVRATDVLVFADGTPVEHLTGARIDATIDVPAGARSLVAAAYASDGVASSSEAITLPVGEAAPPKLWVVAVGVSDYPGLPFSAQLHTADDDARALADALARHVGDGKTYAEGAITVLTDDDVTRASLDDALAGLAAMAPTDVAVVSFAGHGIVDDAGRTVLLLPAADLDDPLGDDEALGWDEIAARLRAAKGRVLVVLDACHTGAVSQDAVALSSDLAGALVDDGRAGTVVLAASKGRQVSLEGAWGGVFTAAVVDAIDDGRELWVSALVTRVATSVGAETHDAQTPWLVASEVFGDWPLISAPGSAPAAPAGAGRPSR